MKAKPKAPPAKGAKALPAFMQSKAGMKKHMGGKEEAAEKAMGFKKGGKVKC